MQRVKPTVILSKLANILLLAQPFLTFPVFISVLLGVPPLWLSWVIAIIPWPLRFYITRRLSCRTPFDIPILILAAGMLLGFFISPDQQLASSALHTYLACVLFYYGVVNNGHAKLGYWVSIAIFLCLVFFPLSVWVFAGGLSRHVGFNSWAYELGSSLNWRLTTGPTNNALGDAFGVAIPTLVGIAFSQQRPWVRWGSIVLAVIFGGILFLSASAGGWVITTAGVFMVLLFRNAKVFWGTFLAMGTIVGATFPIWRNARWVGEVFILPSLIGRMERWQATMMALKEHLLTGLGLGGWWPEVAKYNTSHVTHNAYLQLYSDTGVLGIVALVVALIIGAKIFWQILSSDKGNHYYYVAVGIIAGIATAAAHGLIEDNINVIIPIGNEYIYFAIPLLWLWTALLVVSHQQLKGIVQTTRGRSFKPGNLSE